MINVDTLDFSDEEIQAATNWHGGQSSMLYAVASTGSLSRGSIRPSRECDACDPLVGCATCKGKRIPLTDREWFADLCWALSGEADRCMHLAKTDAPEHVEALAMISARAEQAATECERDAWS